MDDIKGTSIELNCLTKQELPKIAKQIFAFADGIKVWLFVGNLGSGKTTLIKEICTFMGVLEEVSSPTFSIINEYLIDANSLYHFDFYRLKNEQEALNIGVMDYFDSEAYCFIEWPQQVENLLPNTLVLINIENKGGEHRIFKLTKYE